MILKIVHYPLDSERETVSEQFQGSWRLGTAQALHAQYKCVSTVDIRHLGTPYGRVPRFLSTRELTDALCSLYSGDRYFLLIGIPPLPSNPNEVGKFLYERFRQASLDIHGSRQASESHRNMATER